ncbi:serine protease 1-like [Drosophila albomicans]|uniref:Serine protease 1-like n=1 Tax=Drosophila albomicans TaxID=7291 RepID=A0A6P8WH36_DROAB|nr:serine protease 1-like [Drosophila albomicans]
MKVLLLVSLLSVAIASADNSTEVPDELDALPDSIITNGYQAARDQAPYIVFLSFGNSFCGGTIIGPTWVVTASHCTKPYNSVTIYYGSLRRAQGEVVHTVRGNNIINHPSDDIALIRTPRVNFNDNIRSIRLPPQSERNNEYVGVTALACGWGETTSTSTPNRLQCVNLQVISHEECRRTYSSDWAKPQVLCVATPGGKSTCFGDSGGPLTAENNQILIGVTNFVSARGCTSGDPSGFARVTSHLDWINQHTGISY